jgi:hypothetical protein
MVLISDSEERLLKLALLVVYQRSTALYVIHVHMTNPCCPRHTHNNISRRLRYHKGAMGCGCMGCGCMGCGCMGCGCMGCGCMGLAWALHGPCMGLAWALHGPTVGGNRQRNWNLKIPRRLISSSRPIHVRLQPSLLGHCPFLHQIFG